MTAKQLRTVHIKDIRRQRTLEQTIKQYVYNKRLQQQNSESYIKERDNCLKAICSDWFNIPIVNISFTEVEERFNKVAYRKGTLGRAKTWARYMKAIFEWTKQRSYIDNNSFTRLKAEVKTFNQVKEKTIIYYQKKLSTFMTR